MRHLMCPSMNNANFDSLKDETIALDQAGADIFHMDLCDGVLANRLSMGLRDFQAVRRNTKKPMDVHFYMVNPSNYLELFVNEGADILYVFPEAQYFTAMALCKIRQLGRSPGLAIGWGSPFEHQYELMQLSDYVMVNAADPISPQRIFMPTVWEKLRRLVEMKQTAEFKLLIDGAVTPEVAQKAAAIGVDGFAMGTGCLFGKGSGTYAEKIARLRELCDGPQ